tara:strand:- start:82227 stop:83465 length:1239 start_codon:yes stop_codon:yes gene_type:complete
VEKGPLALGIDLGTSGTRIAIINLKKELIYTDSLDYPNNLEESEDWIYCCKKLINNIPLKIKNKLCACSIDGTSGTLIACEKQGNTICKAIPYYRNYDNQKDFISSFMNQSVQYNLSSLGRALHLSNQFGPNILFRHQADWVSGWLTNDWSKGEEGNNIKLGWDLINKCWPISFSTQKWNKGLPNIIFSGEIFNKIDLNRARELDLPKDLLIVAGTTDSNAAVLAANPSDEEGITVLGSTIVLKKFSDHPIYGAGITNHLVSGRWLCGGASNAGGAVLKNFFNPEEIEELSNQINPDYKTGLRLRPLPFKGERFPIDDPYLEPVLTPRPTSDALYLQALLEGLAEIELKGWEKLRELGMTPPKKIISIGAGAKNLIWKKIREKIIQIPIRISKKPPAVGVAMIAMKAIYKNK